MIQILQLLMYSIMEMDSTELHKLIVQTQATRDPLPKALCNFTMHSVMFFPILFPGIKLKI